MYVYLCYMCFVVCICSAINSTIILYTLLTKTLVILLCTMLLSVTHIAKYICRKHIIIFAASISEKSIKWTYTMSNNTVMFMLYHNQSSCLNVCISKNGIRLTVKFWHSNYLFGCLTSFSIFPITTSPANYEHHQSFHNYINIIIVKL